MAREEMPIFTKTYDMLSWLLPATHRFPREHRHDFTLRLLNTAFDLRAYQSFYIHKPKRRLISAAPFRDRVVQCDVKQFFPSIDHAILRSGLAKKIRDPDVMTVVDRILASGVGVLGQDHQFVNSPLAKVGAGLRPAQ